MLSTSRLSSSTIGSEHPIEAVACKSCPGKVARLFERALSAPTTIQQHVLMNGTVHEARPGSVVTLRSQIGDRYGIHTYVKESSCETQMVACIHAIGGWHAIGFKCATVLARLEEAAGHRNPGLSVMQAPYCHVCTTHVRGRLVWPGCLQWLMGGRNQRYAKV